MKKLIVISCITFLFLFTNCKKDAGDTITSQAINGMVYNQCTDSGLAGVTVYLKISKDNSELKSYQTVSGVNGNFSFGSVDIHNNSAYSYAINIPSKSGDGATTPEYCGFIGTTVTFTKDEVKTFFQPRVIPSFLNWCFVVSPVTNIGYPDSLYISFQQKVYHKNAPAFPYSSKRTQSDLQNGFVNCTFGNYPMGLWNIRINKWKSGIYTVINDSIYIGWAATKTYTINW